MVRCALIASLVLLATACERGPEQTPPDGTPQQQGRVSEKPAAKAETEADRLVVYYFHTTVRCPTCTMFEKLTKEIAESSFADDMAADRLELRVVNVEEPDNKHFVEDYRLATKSVVLSLVAGDREQGWTNLHKIWPLARNEEMLREYIRGGIEEHLGRLKG